MIFTCLCGGQSKTKVLGTTLLDCGESPKSVVDFLLRSESSEFPLIVVYDNACQLRHYVMSRFPHLAYKTTFVSDAFHWKNHRGCSCLTASNAWRHLPEMHNANTSAMEQTNRTFRERCEKFISFCNGVNAMNQIELLIYMINNDRSTND